MHSMIVDKRNLIRVTWAPNVPYVFTRYQDVPCEAKIGKDSKFIEAT